MGGDVGVDSEPGMGSSFWFRIRAEVIDAGDRRRALRTVSLRSSNGKTDGEPWRQPLATEPLPMCAKLLVVEDDPTNQKVICAMLATLGMTSVIADDGRQAIGRISGGEVFDLILMDVQMPVMDGIEATAQIRQHEREHGEARRPIIALTADAFAEHRERCLSVGMDDFLTKPVDIAELSRLLRYWLASPEIPVNTAPDRESMAEVAGAVPPAPTFDEAALLRPLGGSRELARLIVVSATDDFPSYLVKLEQACQAADWKTAERLAHTMKGLGAQIGGLELARRMREADEQLKHGGTLDPSVLAQLQAEYAALAIALQSWRKSDGEINDGQ
jgi:CheY-like chemotaxis protein